MRLNSQEKKQDISKMPFKETWNWLASSSVACVCILGKKMAPVIIIQDMKDFPENKMDRILYFIRYDSKRWYIF